MHRYVSMDRLVKDIESFAKQEFPKSAVSSYLAETLIEPNSLSPYLKYEKHRYTRHLVHKNTDFELLVICWGKGHSAPIHGHEGELCWARVEQGRLLFYNFRVLSENPLQLSPEGAPVEGKVGFLDGPAEIHSVANPMSFGINAVSLHLYSKPYLKCDIYESVKGPKRRVRLAYDTIHAQPVNSVPN